MYVNTNYEQDKIALGSVLNFALVFTAINEMEWGGKGVYIA